MQIFKNRKLSLYTKNIRKISKEDLEQSVSLTEKESVLCIKDLMFNWITYFSSSSLYKYDKEMKKGGGRLRFRVGLVAAVARRS